MNIEDRRGFLKKSLAAGTVSLAMPTLASLKLASFHSPASGNFSYAGGELIIPDYRLDELLAKHGNMFEAQASGRAIFAGIARVLPFAAAALTIMNWFGLRSPFSRRPSYAEAKDCTECYRNAQHDLINRGVSYFSDVARPANDVSAMLGSTTPDLRGLNQVTTQGGKIHAVGQTGRDPGVLIASSQGLKAKYPAAEHIPVYFATAIDKRLVRLEDGAIAMEYETPIHVVRYDSRPHPQYPQFNQGTLLMSSKVDRRNPNNLYWMGLTA